MKKLYFALTLLTTLASCQPAYSAVVINEFLADPPLGLIGDANGDGVRSSTQDEFVELFNFGSTQQDLSLWSIWDSTALRHQFPSGSLLPEFERFVIFGGGTPTNIPGLVGIASTGTLSLNNTADQIVFKNQLGHIVDQIGFSSEADRDQSLVRFPEGASAFRLHTEVSSQGFIFSPGTDSEGSQTIPNVPKVPEPYTIAILGIGIFVERKLKKLLK